MIVLMIRGTIMLAGACLALAHAHAHADAGSFQIVNATNTALRDIAVRRYGAAEWRPLVPETSAGARAAVEFKDPDCAFDIRAKLGSNGEAVWSGVNLCEVKAVVLNRDASGTLWVDYE